MRSLAWFIKKPHPVEHYIPLAYKSTHHDLSTPKGDTITL
jgi:hypothetical protein